MPQAAIESYVEAHILPLYERFDPAHRSSHVRGVISESLVLCAALEADADMAYVIAAYHDVGLLHGREAHERHGAVYLRADAVLPRWFSPEQIQTMAEAVEDHRASAKCPPRSLYGCIVAEADRAIDYMTVLTRTVQYGLAQYAQYARDEHFERARAHMENKYGHGGYIKLWLDSPRNRRGLADLRDALRDTARLHADFDRIYDEYTGERV